MTDSTLTERVARVICGKRCLRAQVFGEPCIDEATQRNAPCRATRDQLILAAGIWDAAEAAILEVRTNLAPERFK